jgi:lipopolysaccharide transport protein LptA
MRKVRWWLAAILVVAAFPQLPHAAETPPSPITISADTLELNRKDHMATYSGSVVASDKGRGLTILADQIQFFFDDRMQELARAVATGNVRISYGERRGVADQAEYFPQDARAVLLGHPKVWQDSDTVTGCKITLLLREDRSRVDGCEGERVNAVLYPKQSGNAPRGKQAP